MNSEGRIPASTVLVTGAPRSGTTPVGELLSASPGTIEVYEPMSDVVGDRAVPNWFPIPGQQDFSHAAADDLVERICKRRVRNGFRPKAILGNLGRNRFLNRSRRTAILAKLQPWKRTQIWKDPMAFFVALRVARTTDMPVIVLVRDPLSLASSFARMSWRPPVEGLVERMQSVGMPVNSRIPAAIESEMDAAKAGAVAWNLIYSTLLREMREELPATVISTSDIMIDSEKVRQRLMAATGLSVPAARKSVDETVGIGEPLPEKAHIRNRSLESITKYWKKTLSKEQVRFSRDLNDELWAELEPEIVRKSETG